MKQARSVVRFLGKIEGLSVATVLVALYVAFIFTAPDVFLKWRIYMSFLQTVAPPLIAGIGLTLVITAGEIDLSFPAVIAFTGYIFAYTYNKLSPDINPNFAILIGVCFALLAGGFVGWTNGILVARVGVPSIMATLAAQFFWYGVTLRLASGLQATLKNVENNFMYDVFVGRIYGVIPDPARGRIGIPVQAFWALAVAIVFWFILNRHRFGEAIMFLGDNANVARVMGVNVEATRIRLFTVMGAISGFAGVILTLQAHVFFPTQGQGLLLPVMGAVFIGGTSIAGGLGSVVGTFFGSYIIGSLEAGVVASGIKSFWVPLVEGLVMGASVVLNLVISEGRAATIRGYFQRWADLFRIRREMNHSLHDDTPAK